MANQIPSPEFLSLVQHLELSRAGWWDKALERFILAAFWMNPTSKTATQVSAEIAKGFHIDLDVARLTPHLDRLTSTKALMLLPGRQFVLGEEARRDYKIQLDQAASIEDTAAHAFQSIVAPVVPKKSSEDLWAHFHAAFLVPLIKDLGATTYNLLTSQIPAPVEIRLDAYLNAYPEEVRRPLQSAVHSFLDPSNAAVRSYVLCLLNAYLVLEAVSLSSDDLSAVAAQLSSTPTFNVFVDTNFLLSILGLHDNPSNDAAQGLIRLSKAVAGHVKVRFYVLPLTLEETQRVLIANRDALRGLRLSAIMAQAALNRASSSIAIRFFDHVSKGGSPNSAEAYFEPYINNLLTILRSNGAELFNENTDSYRTRQDVIDDIALQMEYDKKNRDADRRKSYESLLHDTVLWHLAEDKRPERFDSPVEAGYWIVTLDHRLMGFDRFKRKRDRSIPLCLEPTILSQLLQFWMPRSAELEQVVLGSIRMPLMFHAFNRDSERVTVDILRALGRYEAVAQLPKEAVTAIVVNDALRARISSSHSEEEKIELVRDALSAEFDRVKSALSRAEENERRVRADLLEKERSLAALKAEVEGAGRAREQAEQQAEKLKRDLEEDIKKRDEAIDDLRGQVAAIGKAFEDTKAARHRSGAIRQFIIRWLAWELVILGVALAVALLPLSWLRLEYWSRAALLAVTAQVPWIWFAERSGRNRDAVRDWSTFAHLQKLRKWVFIALGATLLSLYHELLAAWVQSHVWRP